MTLGGGGRRPRALRELGEFGPFAYRSPTDGEGQSASGSGSCTGALGPVVAAALRLRAATC